MTARYVVIMAGGSGTRFWPASRKAHPKQFLAIGGEKSLLRQTLERVHEVVDWENILIVTGDVHARHATLEAPELPEENILIEPEGRNTAPCIGWATRVILDRDANAVVAVLPADAYIADTKDFCAHLDVAMNAAAERIVLLGLVPTRPETGYGYIRQSELRSDVDGKKIFSVDAFVEKPDRATAESYLADGGYLWNSGIFVFPAAAMSAAIERHIPELAAGLEKIASNPRQLKRVYPTLPKVSIDYGVMEKEPPADLSVLASTFAWSDVGSWDAASEVYPADDAENVVLGDVLMLESKGCFVDSRAGRFITLSHVEGLVVVDTTDAVLVMKKGESQSVKTIVEMLKGEADREELT
jgi:mannose-1-phosphate guanylyltransferase